jgi:NADH-ubiquinone oxidoreductase chain 6
MNILLDMLALGAVLSGILVITAKNPVISVLFLISVFLNVAGYLVLMGVAYLGLVYIIVYVGAIAILFLFVVMMLNLRLVELLDTGKAYTQNLPVGTILGSLFFFELLSLTAGSTMNGRSAFTDDPLAGLLQLPMTLYNKINAVIFGQSDLVTDTSVHVTYNPMIADASFTNYLQIESIGQGLYTYATLWLAMASFILLLSMVGPIILCLNRTSLRGNQG